MEERTVVADMHYTPEQFVKTQVSRAIMKMKGISMKKIVLFLGVTLFNVTHTRELGSMIARLWQAPDTQHLIFEKHADFTATEVDFSHPEKFMPYYYLSNGWQMGLGGRGSLSIDQAAMFAFLPIYIKKMNKIKTGMMYGGLIGTALGSFIATNTSYTISGIIGAITSVLVAACMKKLIVPYTYSYDKNDSSITYEFPKDMFRGPKLIDFSTILESNSHYQTFFSDYKPRWYQHWVKH